MLITEAGEAPSTSQELAHQRPPLGNTASKTGARQTLLRHNGSPPSLFRHWNSHTYIHWKSHHLKVKHFASHFELKKFNFFRAPVPSTTSPVQGQRRRPPIVVGNTDVHTDLSVSNSAPSIKHFISQLQKQLKVVRDIVQLSF